LLDSIDLLSDDGGSTFPQLPSDKQERSNRGSGGDDEIDCSEEGRGGGATKKELIGESQQVTAHDSRIRTLDLSKNKGIRMLDAPSSPFCGRV
jgi:hypothetical protein